MKYAALLMALDECQLYTPISIAEWAEETGHAIFTQDSETSRERIRVRIQVALAGLARRRGFPVEGDNRIKRGRRSYPAWWGWRWHSTIRKPY